MIIHSTILCTNYKNKQLIYMLLSCITPLAVSVLPLLLLLNWTGVRSSVWLLVIEF